VTNGPRMKHASNAYRFTTSKEEVHKKVKKASWWKKLLLCQNIDIRHGQCDAYKANRNVMKELKRINQPMDVDPSQQQASDGTLSYGHWSQGRVDWSMFEDVSSSSRPHGQSSTQEDQDDEDEDEEEEDDDDYSG
jgi:hypothetical protein